MDFEQLDCLFKEADSKGDTTSLEDVANLTQALDEFKRAEGERQEALGFFQKMKNVPLRFKINAYERKLEAFQKQAEKNKDRMGIEKRIWDLQKKGFILPLTKEQCTESFLVHTAEMKALGCNKAFTFIVDNRQEGQLSCMVYTPGSDCRAIPVTLNEPFFTEVFLGTEAPDAVPLSQLQEVSVWLQGHGQKDASLLTLREIEEKLEPLMKSCPYGAYVMHTVDNALTVSRINPAGAISHLKIDLQRAIGCFSFEHQGKVVCDTRTEFKRRLEKMGKPVRMRLHEQ